MTAVRRTALLRLWRAALEWQRILPSDGSHAGHIAAVQTRVIVQERARNAEAAGAITHEQAAAAIRAIDPDAVVAVVRWAFVAVASPGESFASAEPVLDDDAVGDPLRVDVVGLSAGEVDKVADILLRLRRVGLPPVTVVRLASAQDALHAATADTPDMLVARGLMPGIDGPWLIDEIRKAEAALGLSRLPMMVVSSASTYRQAALQAGADHVEELPIRPDALGAAFLAALASIDGPLGTMAEPGWSDRESANLHVLARADTWQRSLDRIGDAMLPWRAAYEARALLARSRLVDSLAAAWRGGVLSAEQVHLFRRRGYSSIVSAAIDEALRSPSPSTTATPAAPQAATYPRPVGRRDPGLPDDAPVVQIAFADGEDGDPVHSLLRRILERRERIRVEHASAEWGVHAVELAFANPRPDLMVVHQLMAWKAGEAVIREVRCREAELGLPNMPIVAWDNQAERLEGCRDAGATLVCEEGPGYPEVVELVRSILKLPAREASQTAT